MLRILLFTTSNFYNRPNTWTVFRYSTWILIPSIYLILLINLIQNLTNLVELFVLLLI